MTRCDFCKKEIKPGTGKMFVKVDGRVINFCSKKCEKNMFKLRRIPHTLKWIVKKKKVKP